MSKQKLKQQIEEIFQELNLQDLPLSTTFESSVDEMAGGLQQKVSQQGDSKKSPAEVSEFQLHVDADTLLEINETIDLIPYVLNSFSQINGLSNLLIQGIDGALSEQQLSDVTAIRRISESQSFLLKEIEELSRRSQSEDAKKSTAFSVHDLLTQIQTVFLKGEYRGAIRLGINCPHLIPSLYTDSVFLRRSIVHSLELLFLFEKEILIDVENSVTDQGEQTLQFHIHIQKDNPKIKQKPPTGAILKSARLHQFFIEHWIKQIDGQVVFDQDLNLQYSNIHIHIPIIEDPNAFETKVNEIEKQIVLLISQTTLPTLKEAAKQLDWQLKQIKNKNDLDELEQLPIHSCFVNISEYQTKWQDINNCLFMLSVSDTPIIPIILEPQKQISAWFPEARIMINPIEPNEISSLVQHLANQYHFNTIYLLDRKQYLVRSLKSLENKFAIQSFNRATGESYNLPSSILMIINLQLSENEELLEETSYIQECFTKKIPVILLLPEETNHDKAQYLLNMIKSSISKKDGITTKELVRFLTKNF